MYRMQSRGPGRQATSIFSKSDCDGLRPSDRDPDRALSSAERRNVALAALQIQEQRYRVRLAQIAAEKRAILAAASASSRL